METKVRNKNTSFLFAATDHFSASYGPAEGLRYALVTGSFTSLIAIGLFLLASKTIEADLPQSSAP